MGQRLIINENDVKYINPHKFTVLMSIEWKISDKPVAYPDAHAFMEDRVRAIHEDGAPDLVWLLEHPPLYTAGTSAKAGDLLSAGNFPVYETGRGGQYTYHGPGQRVAYVMMDLKRRAAAEGGQPDIRKFVQSLENWIIATLDEFNIKGFQRDGRVGVWVDRSATKGAGAEDKIAAIGIRIRKWVTFHGISLNVDPDLSHFNGIVPCGIADEKLGVTSLVDMGLPVTMADADLALKRSFAKVFDETA